MENYYVIEGDHVDHNDIKSIKEDTKNQHGPFAKDKAEDFAKSLIQKNIDNFYHRAWVVDSNNLTK